MSEFVKKKSQIFLPYRKNSENTQIFRLVVVTCVVFAYLVTNAGIQFKDTKYKQDNFYIFRISQMYWVDKCNIHT